MSNDIQVPDYLPGWIKDHIELYLTDPEKAHLWDSSLGGGEGMLPTLLLISKGRKSGEPRPLPLIYRKIDDTYVIVASKGGAPAHPAWYLNLEAEPACEIRVGAEIMQARARTATGAERARLWDALAEIYPPYNDYQVAAGDREIPVVVLEPV
jgi:deazaflavin-dependent oxidoreductase (nitroreductase family)